MAGALRSTWRARLRGERGTSLAELLVVVVLVTIVMAIASTLLISGQRVAGAATSRSQVTGSAREALQEMTRSLRTAVRPAATVASPFVTDASDALADTGDRSVTFYANDRPGSGPSRVTFSVDAAGVLTESRTAATATAPYAWTAATTSRVLLRGVAATVLLRYYDDATTCDNGCLLTTSGTPAVVASAQLPKIRMVEVVLVVSDPARPRSRPVRLIERVGVVRSTGALT